MFLLNIPNFLPVKEEMCKLLEKQRKDIYNNHTM